MGGEKGSNAGESSTGYPKLVEKPVGQRIENIYRDRLNQFTTRGQYGKRNLTDMWDADRENRKEYVKLEAHSVPDLARPTFEEATKFHYEETRKGTSWGPSWSTHWFRITVKIPERMNDVERVEFRWDTNPAAEAMVWTTDGVPLQGLTGGGERTGWPMPKEWRDGKEHTFYLEMACNGMFGVGMNGDSIQPPDPNKYFSLTEADIVVPDLQAWALYYDFWMIGDAAREFPNDTWERHEALKVATEIVDAFVPGDKESVKKGREIAQRYIGKKVNSEKVYEDDGRDVLVFGTGHCHIDTCWLWPWAETKRKVARSWSTQVALMDEYPEYRFTCSQAQQYKWLKQYYPPLFDRVKAKVKSGQFQYIGGSWVEHDTNMPSGESLVRQFITGQRFFESHFGSRCETFWLPDTFGYSAQLPQLCRLAGLSRFLTQKLSWNNINKFPHTTFNWVALDGSQVLCHMPPSETYTASAHFGDVKRSVTQHKSLDNDKTSMLVFGKGDGGGGPTIEMIEKLRRLRGMSDTIGLLPRCKMGDSVDDFFRKIEKRIANGQEFVTWYGELYFEFHRGTYTTQAHTKRNVRKGEFLLHDIEFLATFASLKEGTNYMYPKEQIDELWENMCLCQFHDCLPGSSIEMVYDDAGKLFTEFFKTGEKLLQEAFDALHTKKSSGKTEPYVLNTHGWSRTAIMDAPAATASEECSVFESTGPGLASKAVKTSAVKPGFEAKVSQVSDDVFVLENGKLRATIEGGNITSLRDLEKDREVIVHGKKGNQLVIFDDKPLYWQAWDVEVYHLDTREEIPAGKVKIHENGPLRASLQVTNEISSKSKLTTIISLNAAVHGSESFIEFDCDLDWHEDMRFLKVEFPVDIRNTEASYECQFGIVKRPTHYNTSWDMAKFEVCCHKWADLSEAGYGVTIFNDCKYGFAVAGNVMRLSLIRAPKAPDAHADMGQHKFKYAIMPHGGSLDERVVRTGYDFNNQMRVQHVTPEAVEEVNSALRGIWLEGDDGVVLDTVKRGEDDEDNHREGSGFTKRKGRSIILRLYDSLGGRQVTTIKTKYELSKVYKTNILEDDLERVALKKDNNSGVYSAEVVLRPFEVATFRLQLA